jgi:hypothetical protein
MGDAKAGSAHPAPAENETGRQQDEPAHDEDGEEGVEQGDEVGKGHYIPSYKDIEGWTYHSSKVGFLAKILFRESEGIHSVVREMG